MNINISQSGAENLLDLILNANSQAPAIELEEIEFGSPVVQAGSGNRNTSVALVMKPQARFAGSQTFAYSRLQVNSAVAEPVFEVSYIPSTTFNQLKQLIATALSVRVDDITFDGLPDSGGNPVDWDDANGVAVQGEDVYQYPFDLYGYAVPQTFSMTARQSSLLYIGTVDTSAHCDRVLADAVLTVLDGFDYEEAVLADLIPTFMDGFDAVVMDLGDLIEQTFLDGFDPVPDTRTDLNSVVSLVFEGANAADAVTAEELVTGPLDGWWITEAELDGFIDDSLDGFTGIVTNISTLIPTYLDGFVYAEGSLPGAIEDFLDGFDLTSNDLDEQVPAFLNGFDQSDGSLETSMSEFLDGFDLTPNNLSACIPDFLGGFTGVITDLDVLVDDYLDGFDWTETSLEDLIDTFLEGFDQQPEWRTLISDAVSTVFVGVNAASAVPAEELVSGPLDGFIDQDS